MKKKLHKSVQLFLPFAGIVKGIFQKDAESHGQVNVTGSLKTAQTLCVLPAYT